MLWHVILTQGSVNITNDYLKYFDLPKVNINNRKTNFSAPWKCDTYVMYYKLMEI